MNICIYGTKTFPRRKILKGRKRERWRELISDRERSLPRSSGSGGRRKELQTGEPQAAGGSVLQMAVAEAWIRSECVPRGFRVRSLAPNVEVLRGDKTFKRWGLVESNELIGGMPLEKINVALEVP